MTSKVRTIRTKDKFKFKMPQSTNIVGIPDLYNELKENEVFVYLEYEDSIELKYLTEIEVLVSRYPMHHRGDIRKFKAVHNVIISIYLSIYLEYFIYIIHI